MKKKNKGRYLKKFKSYAINLVVNDGMSVYSAARQLSMPKSTLAGWIRKLQRAKSIEKSAVPKEPSVDSTEIEQLKQDLAKVKKERDDLKKRGEVVLYSPDGHLESSRKDVAIKQLYTDNPESLLDNARMQWQFGDWESLANLGGNKLQHHPDRAKLALLVATGWQQLNDQKKTHQYIKLARKWGCDKQLIARLLIAGVHNTLGCAAAACRQENRALNHFRSAVKGVSGDARLACQARSVREITKLGLLQQAATQISQELNDILPQKTAGCQVGLAASGIKVLQIEIEVLQHALSLAHQRQQPTRRNVTKTDLTNEKKTYYGFNDLDRKLEKYIDYDSGFFVELGANDGINQSNTYYFEKYRKWRGVLVEPVPHNLFKCRENRSKENICFCAACVSFDYKDKFVEIAYSNLMSTPMGLDSDITEPIKQAEAGEKYLKNGECIFTYGAEATTLNDLLVKGDAPALIDLLSLDVEGAELEVLKGIDHDMFSFKFILVECRSPERLMKYLEKFGYSCVEKLSHHDYLFVDTTKEIVGSR